MTLVKHYPKNANAWLNDFFYSFPNNWGADFVSNNSSTPPVNIHETNEGFHVEMSAPGRNKEYFKVKVEKGLLTIAYEENKVDEKKEYKTIRREFGLNNFKRSFTLDEQLNADGIQAKYENGILQLFVPKKEEIKIVPKEITVL